MTSRNERSGAPKLLLSQSWVGGGFQPLAHHLLMRTTHIARKLRRSQTSAEEKLWAQLRDRRCEGVKFRRQVPIANSIADFACMSLALTIELDGEHHSLQPISDRMRREVIETHGYFEIRFTNDEVHERLDWVMTEIKRAIDIARACRPRTAHPRWN
jgi:very-short-patch-repair endonuclease